MSFRASVNLKIPFHDVDIMHIAWHGHYLKYFELARTKLMQELELDWPILKDKGIAMPVVDAEAHYRKPLKYDQELDVEARIEEFQFPELVIHYTIREGSTIYSTGRTRQVYWDNIGQTTYFEIPEFVRLTFEAKSL